MIEQIRDDYYLSQREMARLLGVGHPTVSRWERGETEPSPFHRALIRRLREKAEEEGTSFLRFLLSCEEAEDYDAVLHELYREQSLTGRS